MKKLILLLISFVLAGCSLFGIQSEDSPVYGLMEEDDDIEIRHYFPYLTAQTEDAGDYESASNLSFLRLFDYINGKNQSRETIAMTAPVLQEQAGNKIEMTAPVFQEQSGNKWIMRFVLPVQYTTISTAPKPSDPNVKLVEIPDKKVAVLQFSGFLSDSAITEKKAELTAWLKNKKIKPLSDARSAGYNPPWTIPFLRRNEIHIDIE
ncbi:MAG: heme-binding protein [Gammaproteobacteria bacterium]|nr:heme-binding protein [Gammaproteobacteria bacterium]